MPGTPGFPPGEGTAPNEAPVGGTAIIDRGGLGATALLNPRAE
jgi:hypothetical protein